MLLHYLVKCPQSGIFFFFHFFKCKMKLENSFSLGLLMRTLLLIITGLPSELILNNNNNNNKKKSGGSGG